MLISLWCFSLGKTETIKKRAAWIYLPTIELRKKWENLSKKSGMSFSSWIVNNVRENLENRSNLGISRKNLEEENTHLKEELAIIQKKLRDTTIIKDNLERDIQKYRTEPFLQSDFKGIRKYDKNLIDILRSTKKKTGTYRYVTNDEILSRLDIEHSDTELVKGISVQLARLENYGLVKSGPKGWRWQGEQ